MNYTSNVSEFTHKTKKQNKTNHAIVLNWTDHFYVRVLCVNKNTVRVMNREEKNQRWGDSGEKKAAAKGSTCEL